MNSKEKKREDTNHQYQGWNRESSTDPDNIKRIIRECCEQLYTHRFDKLNEMDLRKHKLSELTQSETNHLNNTVTSKEIEFIRREGETSNSLYESSITLIPKSDKDSTKK